MIVEMKTGLFDVAKWITLKIAIFATFFICVKCYASTTVFLFEIAEQRADQALVEYAKITNLDVIFSHDVISQYRSQKLDGFYAADVALKKLLNETPLIIEKTNDDALIIKKGSMLQNSSTVKNEQSFLPIEEIVVNAQKRTERLIDIPVAITVLDSEQLENRSVTTLSDIKTLVPSLSIRKGNTSRNSSIFLRGLGTTSFSIGAEPSVSTVVDGVVLARSGQAFTWYDEFERVEVLRGPQGTLFGKNASAGVLNIVTKKPSRSLEGSIALSYFDDKETNAKISVTGPVSQNWSGRLSGFTSRFDGPHHNQFNGESVNGHDREALRGLLNYRAHSMDVMLSLEWFDSNDNCCIELTAKDTFNSDNIVATLRSVNHDLMSETLDTTIAAAANITWNLKNHDMISITAYREWETTEIADRDFGPSVDGLFQTAQSRFQLHETGFQNSKQFSQEFRLESIDNDVFNYSLGAFYLDVDVDRDFRRDDILCIETNLANNACSFSSSQFLFPSATADLSSSFTNYALFGEGRYTLSDTFLLSGGLRWTRDSVSYSHARIGNEDHRILVSDFGLGAPGIRNMDFASSDKQDATDLSGKLGVQYKPTDRFMAYATYATGFKGPAFDISFSLNEQRTAPVKPEQSKSYEIGFKKVSSDGQFYNAFNMYYVELDGFQTNSIQVLNDNITSSFINAGLVVNAGVEADFIAKLSSRLSIVGGVNYLYKAEIEEPICAGFVNTSACRSGERLPLAPRLKATFGLDYEMPLTRRSKLSIGTNYSYRTDMFSDNDENPLEVLDSLSILNLNATISSIDDTHSVKFIANNVTNEHFADQIICCSVSGDERFLRYQISRDADRYFGIEYKLSF